MITEIDFFRLLHDLQSLNVRKADNETLINYVAKLEYVEEVFLSSSQKQQENFKSVFLSITYNGVLNSFAKSTKSQPEISKLPLLLILVSIGLMLWFGKMLLSISVRYFLLDKFQKRLYHKIDVLF